MVLHQDIKSPLITIITASYNCKETIQDAIDSLRAQTYTNFEYIVVDGGSTDGTVEIVRSNPDIVSLLISEKDSGIADAWNKGIRLSKGEIIGLLNADDMYHRDTLRKMLEAYVNCHHSIIYGECRLFDSKGINQIVKGNFRKERLTQGFGFVHTTCFVPRAVYEKVGLFNLNTKIAVDTDFLLRALNHSINFQKGRYWTYMRKGGLSDVRAKEAFVEYIHLLISNRTISSLEGWIMEMLYSIYHPFRTFRKSDYVGFPLRKAKHFIVFLINLIHQLLPSFYLKIIFLRKFFRFNFGTNSYILKNVKFYWFGNIHVGNNVVINRNCLLDNRGEIKIGNNVSIAHGCKIYTSGHDYNSPFNDLAIGDVRIDDHVIIFANVQIQPNVHIGEGAVILPGSIVTNDVRPYSVFGGIPAKQISDRNRAIKYQHNYPFWYAL